MPVIKRIRPSWGRMSYVLSTLALSLAGTHAAPAATPFSSASLSPDTTVDLDAAGGGVFADEDVAVDNLLGIVVPAALGTLPGASDVSGYQLLGNGDQLLCFDTGTELPGPVDVAPGNVVRFDGASYAIELDASANGVPAGAHCDAIAVGPGGEILLSFDTTVSLPGAGPAVVAADEDLVEWTAPAQFTLFFDGSAQGLPEAADLDGAQLLAQSVFVSLDVTAAVGGVTADDEDVLEYDTGSATWSLALDASAQDGDWAAADADAVALPEPGLLLLLGAGIAGLLMIGRGRIQA